MNGDDAAARQWLETENIDLGGRPIDVLGMKGGLDLVCGYVEDNRRRS